MFQALRPIRHVYGILLAHALALRGNCLLTGTLVIKIVFLKEISVVVATARSLTLLLQVKRIAHGYTQANLPTGMHIKGLAISLAVRQPPLVAQLH
jgi:hypothetical protein